MSYKRAVMPHNFPAGDDLTPDMNGIGMNFTGEARSNPNIENTLFAASIEGLNGDGKVLSVLTSWIDIHFERINLDRLYKMILTYNDERIKYFWTGMFQWKGRTPRYKKIRKLAKKKKNIFSEDLDLLVKIKGEDERFIKTCLLVPKNYLRIRGRDAMPPGMLAKYHNAYKYRLIIGPTYRADMWALNEDNPQISTYNLAKQTHGSYATAWQVKKDYSVLKLSACS